jgi:hypothetical protein
MKPGAWINRGDNFNLPHNVAQRTVQRKETVRVVGAAWKFVPVDS